MKRIVWIVLGICLLFSFTGCLRYQAKEELSDVIENLEVNPGYAIVGTSSYKTKDLYVKVIEKIQDKLDDDNKSVFAEKNRFRYHGKAYSDSIAFSYLFNKSDDEYRYIIGYLDFKEFELHSCYFTSTAYDAFDPIQTDNNICCYLEYQAVYGPDDDGNVIPIFKENDCLVVTVSTGDVEIKDKDSYLDYEASEKEVLTEEYYYTENTVTYSFTAGRTKLVKEDETTIDVPSFEDILSKATNLGEVEPLLEKADYRYETYFVSIGDELFVAINLSTDLYSSSSYPSMVYKCDTSFQTFTYVGYGVANKIGIIKLS